MSHIRSKAVVCLIFLLLSYCSQGRTKARSNQYKCLNGKNPKNLTPKEILIEFSRGKCSPLLVVPALFSTRLVVEIDCETMRIEHPDIFETCGWNSCSKKIYQFWKHIPKKEYYAWMPSFFSPLSILQIHEQKNYCWVKLMSLAVDFGKPIEAGVIEQKGFKIKIFGQTPETANSSNCGDSANENMLNNKWFELRTTKYLSIFHQKLKNLGYVAGLTYQSLPYDFRLSYRANQLTKIFKPNLKRLYALTGKKVVIAGHSLGNVNIYHQLMQLTRDEKDKMVKNWIAVASALGGSINDMKSMVGGDSTYLFLKGLVGMHYHAEIDSMHHIISAYELLPYDPFTIHKNQPWLRAYRQRLLYEQGKLKYEDSGFPFLPKLEEKCTPSRYYGYTTECRLGLVDSSKQTVLQIVKDKFKVPDVKNLIKKYPLVDGTMKFFEYTRDNKMARFDNPGVPLIAVNLRTGHSPTKFIYKQDIRKFMKNHKFPYPTVETGYGDGIIGSTIQFAWPLKWAYEYENRMEGSKPVKFVDACSTYNIKYDAYDEKDESKAYEIKKNEFFGIECECILDRNANNCDHANIFLDDNVHELIFNIIQANDISYSEVYAKFIASLDDKELKEMVTTCPQINPETFEDRAQTNNRYTAYEV